MTMTGADSLGCERAPDADPRWEWVEKVPSGQRTLGQLIGRLAGTIADLSTHRPDPSDGDGWLSFDAALSDLYGALIALERLDRDGW